MANRYPKYRLKQSKTFEYANAAGLYSRRLEAGATGEYFAHSDTYIFASRDGICPWFDGAQVEESPEEFEPVDYYVFLGGLADFGHADGDSLLACGKGKSVVWTATKTTRIDDEVFFYITSPISALVARGRVVGDIWKNDDANSDWEGYWMAEIGDIVHFGSDRRIPIKMLREVFDDWRWLKMPRQNQRIPAEMVSPFLEMVNGRK